MYAPSFRHFGDNETDVRTSACNPDGDPRRDADEQDADEQSAANARRQLYPSGLGFHAKLFGNSGSSMRGRRPYGCCPLNSPEFETPFHRVPHV